MDGHAETKSAQDTTSLLDINQRLNFILSQGPIVEI
jgi:hypothetical protein